MPKIDIFAYPRGGPRYRPITNTTLFFDVVGFTKHSNNQEMLDVIQKIENVMNNLLWEEYNWNEKKKRNDLILIPTGDGYGVGFHPNMTGEKILNISKEVLKNITKDNFIKIRMGIAKGPNIRHLDLNDKNNLFGYGINLANRVMSLALDNQILVHEDFAKELLREKNVEGLIEVDEIYEVKHGVEIRIYNYCIKGEFGNPEIPTKKK